MKVTCKTENLSNAFQLVSSVVESKATKRILQDVKVETVGKDALQLSATDLEIAMRCQVTGVEVKTEGAIVVPAASMSAILRESSDEAMELALEGDNCEVKGSDSFFRLPTQDPEEYPVIPEFPKGKAMEVAREEFQMMIRRTAFCSAAEQTRYALNGVLFSFKKGKLTLVATDGRRLARIVRKAKGDVGELKHVIVPIKGVVLLERMLGMCGEETVEIAVHENKFWARAGETTLCTTLVEGQFPDYEGVIPSDPAFKIAVPVAEMTSAVKRVALLMDTESQTVRLKFTEGQLTLNYEGAERGRAQIDVKVDYSGGPFDICFNPHFILDVLKVVGDEGVELALKDSETAGVFRVGEDYLYLIMPISLAQSEG
ncbi:MAG: DNA polymerase III subunit beta [Planctomycetota bacterium]